VLVPLGALAGLAILWTGLWFYGAGKADAAITGWRERESRVGRTYACGSQTVGGFPFQIKVSCTQPRIELSRENPPLAVQAGDLLVFAQVFEPTRLAAYLVGPLTVGEAGQDPRYRANWTSAEVSARGTPRAPEQVSFAVEHATVERVADGDAKPAFTAEHADIDSRIIDGSAAREPVIGITLHLAAAAAPQLHPITAEPIDADVSAVLRGLADFAPKPWLVRLKELQERGGSIEITKARAQQGDTIAVSTGTLALTPRGTLEGQLEVTVVGLERILKALDLDRIMAEGRIGASLNSLDNIIPGLGRLARRNAAPGIMAGLGMIGQKTTLEGRSAVAFPLRFADGAVSLGPIPVGRVPPLF
jgi:hypothetical protein